MESTAEGDVNSLSEEVGSFPHSLDTIQQAVSQSATDLKQEKADASAGPGSDTSGEGCVGIANAVYNDAVSALYNDRQSALLGGVDNLGEFISAARKDIATVQQDQKTLAASGLPGTSGASAQIQTAEAQISSAITTANQDTDSVAANVAAGYQLADSVLSGNCSGEGVSTPGSAPTPPAHLT